MKISFLFFLLFSLLGVNFPLFADELPNELPLPLFEIRRSIEEDYSLSFSHKKEAEKVAEKVAKKETKGKKVLSPGEKKIQAMLEKNRARIKARYEKERPEKDSSPWQDPKGQESWIKKKRAESSRWQREREKEIKAWKKARLQFLKELPALKKELTPLGDLAQADRQNMGSQKIGFNKGDNKEALKKSSPRKRDSGQGILLVAGAFKKPVRSQGKRPTCSAFAAIRAIEILAHAQRDVDLSEQYFYYKSKPKCQQRPCSKAGSWPLYGFMASSRGGAADIPLESTCRYRGENEGRNQTQIPLPKGCYQGVAQVKSFSEVKETEEVFERLSLGQPVIGGFKLSENFFINNGYVFKEDKSSLGQGLHAQGHALLLIGLMELPRELHSSQGEQCILTVNSWGEGWGKGGYACLSKAWFETYRYDMPFLVLEEVAIK